MNWLQGITYDWILWLQAFEDEAHTWTETQTFEKGIGVSTTTADGTSVGVAVNGAGVGIALSGGAEGIGVYSIAGSGTGPIAISGRAITGLAVTGESLGSAVAGFFQASSSGEALYVQSMGSVRGAFMTHGTTGNAHTCYLEGYAGAATNLFAPLYVEQMYSAPSGWAKRAPAIVVGQGTIVFTGTDPAATQDPGNDNAIFGALIPKVWGCLSIDGNGNVTTLDGCNVASVAISLNTICTITFARPFSSAIYAMVFTVEKAGNYNAVCNGSKFAGSTQFNIWSDNGTLQNLDINAFIVCFVAFGRQ